MKKRILQKIVLLIITSLISPMLFAQCGTIMVGSNQHFYPDTIINIPEAKTGAPYHAIIQFYAPTTYNNQPVDSVELYTFSTLPSGANLKLSSTTALPNSSSCIVISSPQLALNQGIYNLNFTFRYYTSVGGGGYSYRTLNGYKLKVSGPATTSILGNNYVNTQIGTTLNNQQTNGSAYRRVQVLPNNNIGVTWTTSSDGSPFLSRGTGYNQYNGSNWIKPDSTSARIEFQRAGFPSYAFNPNTNEELVLSHIVNSNGTSGGFVMCRKNVTATAWNQSTVLDTIASVPGLLWCRTAISNNYLHVVACYTDSTQNQPNRVIRNGVRTPVVYSRYNFTTNTWDIKTIALPGYNSTRYYNGTGDSYSIDANATNVALLIGSPGQDLSLWKSTNNGNSWTKTIVDTFYQSPFIESKTLIDPPLLTPDVHLHVLIDNSGNSHCFWSQISLYNPDTLDGGWSYFPANSHQELKYWKEGNSLSVKATIANFNGDPINVTTWNSFSGQAYGRSYYLANPSAGISTDGKIYCTYTSPTEGDDPIGSRDVYLVYSSNAGLSWSSPRNLTSLKGTGKEQAFSSIARTVNSKIHLVYSESESVGPNSAGSWNVNYFSVDTSVINRNQQCKYTISDTILCAGQSLYYSIINAKIYINDTLINSGQVIGSIKPTQNINIKIRTIDGLVLLRNTTIYVDNINVSSSLPNQNLSICGTNTAFNLSGSTTYTQNKTFSWFLNDTLLNNRNLIADTFSRGGQYKLKVTSSYGCNDHVVFNVSKLNSTFNPNFSSNRQVVTAPPFDFTFANQTQPLNDYNYFWKWGDGITDSTNNQILFKTFNNNGQYTVKLIAQHKVTGCKDSLTKVNYISCSGFNPQPLGITTTKQNPFCAGEATGAITVNGTGGVTPYTYRINAGTYQTSNTFNNLVAGIYTIDIKDAANNISTKKDTLLNPPLVTVGVITGPNNVPVSSIQSYSIAAQSGASYLWNVLNGTLLTGNGTTAIQVQWPAGSGVGKIIASVNKGNCGATDSLIVAISPQPLGVASTKQNPFCAGEATGSITVSGSGGTAPYLYRINGGAYQTSNTFNNLIAGVYNLDVKDAINNTVTKKDTVTNPPAITVGGINGLNGVPVSSMQSYSIAAQSGASYSWTVLNGTLLSGNGTTSIQVQWPVVVGFGKVIVALSKGNCGAADTLTVAIGGSPLSLSTTKLNEACSGTNNGSISITASGGNPPYMYALDNGTYQSGNIFGNLTAGVYNVKVKDNSQVLAVKYDTITSGAKPVAGIITGPISVATLAMHTYIVGQQTGVNYLWNINGGVVASGQNTNVVQVAWGAQSMVGKVSVKVTNTGGCSDSSDLNVNVGNVGTNELSISNKVQIYPNPNNGSFAIDVLNSNIEQVDIFNSIGELIWSYTSNETKQSVLEVSLKTTPGIYMVSVKTESGVVNQKLILTQ